MKRFVSYGICVVLIIISFCIHYRTSCGQLEGIIEKQEKCIVNSKLVTNEPVLDKQSAVTGSSIKELQLYATSAVLLDGASGRVLYGKNEDQAMPMASTTKIMTCICALENGNLSDWVTISEKATRQPKVRLGAKEGERYQLKDLLYSLMLESHNDVAVAIAEHISGSVEAFAQLMNQKAIDLGCYHTYFITPNGLDANVTLENGKLITHHTTAEELAKIMAYCVLQSGEKDTFLEITRTAQYQFSDYEQKKVYSVSNHNAFLTMMDGTLSGKTGFTNQAGYCYVGALKREERVFIVALLACGWPNNKNYKWSDTKMLMNYGLEHYRYEERKSGDLNIVLQSIPVYGSHCFSDLPVMVEGIYEKNELFSVLKADEENEVIETELQSYCEAPIIKGDNVGMIKYRLNGKTIKTFSINAAEEVEKKTVIPCIKELFLFTVTNVV